RRREHRQGRGALRRRAGRRGAARRRARHHAGRQGDRAERARGCQTDSRSERSLRAMFLSDLAIKRPTVTVVTMLALVIFGIFALWSLKVDEFPDVAEPVIAVSIVYPGASPEGVERELLDPIEEAISGASGIDKMQSTAQDGFAQIIVFW